MLPKLLLGCGDRGLDRRLVGDVDLVNARALADLSGDPLCRLPIEVEQGDPGAALSQALGESRPDSAAGSGDDPGKPHQVPAHIASSNPSNTWAQAIEQEVGEEVADPLRVAPFRIQPVVGPGRHADHREGGDAGIADVDEAVVVDTPLDHFTDAVLEKVPFLQHPLQVVPVKRRRS